MKNRSRSNVLLVEILIAVLFFMLSATVILQVFAAARNMAARSGVETRALAEAQNVADALYAAPDAGEALREMEFIQSHGAWSKECDGFSLYVEESTDFGDAGALWHAEVSAFYQTRNPVAARQEDEQLFTLPCSRYEEARP